MSINNENQPLSVSIHLGSLTTDATLVPAMYLPKKSKIVGAHLVNGATVAASDSNYVQLALKSGSTVLAEIDSRAAHENGLVANVAKALNLVTAETDGVAAASSLSVLYNETGTVALTDAKLVLSYFPL